MPRMNVYNGETTVPAVVESPVLKELFAEARRIAPTDAPVLVLGETGAGKEILVRAIHEASARRGARFVAVNCAALPPQMVEASFFGHERGAFTGAVQSRAGIFEQAGCGSVFLDEIGELSPEGQAALLRVLEERRLTRIGAEREVAVQARVLAATHRDLEVMVQAGTFRQDLLYRLNAIALEVPPLRKRREEILPLAEHFLELAHERWQCGVPELSPATMELLLSYEWPGNVRQLRNVLERGALLCGGQLFEPEHLRLPRDLYVPERSAVPSAVAGSVAEHGSLDLRASLRTYEARLIEQALRRTGGNQRRAAELLNIPRRTLVRKLGRITRSVAP